MANMRKADTQMVSFRCPRDLLAQMDAYAEKRMLTRAGILNMALQAYLQSQAMIDKMLETNFNELVKQQMVMAEYQKVGSGSDDKSDS